MSNEKPMVSAAKWSQASGCLSEANSKGRKGPRESVVQFEPQMNERWDFR